jgi:hypothetical protein
MPIPDVNGRPAPEHIEAVRRRLAVGGPATTSPGLFVRNYRHTAAQTPGWRPTRVRQPVPAARPDVLRLTQVMLAAEDAGPGLVKLEVYETASAEAARELLVELLTGFQALPEALTVGRDLGEADVVLPGDQARLFARGNLVLALTGAGPLPGGVGAIASSVDRFLTAAPRGAAPRRRRAAHAAAGPAAEAPEGAMLRFVHAGGSLSQGDDGVIRAADGSTPAAHALDEREDAWHPLAPPADQEDR